MVIINNNKKRVTLHFDELNSYALGLMAFNSVKTISRSLTKTKPKPKKGEGVGIGWDLATEHTKMPNSG